MSTIVDRKNHNSYRMWLSQLSNEDLKKEIWLIDEHIVYLQKQDSHSAREIIQLLVIAIEEKDVRAMNKGYM